MTAQAKNGPQYPAYEGAKNLRGPSPARRRKHAGWSSDFQRLCHQSHTGFATAHPEPSGSGFASTTDRGEPYKWAYPSTDLVRQTGYGVHKASAAAYESGSVPRDLSDGELDSVSSQTTEGTPKVDLVQGKTLRRPRTTLLGLWEDLPNALRSRTPVLLDRVLR